MEPNSEGETGEDEEGKGSHHALGATTTHALTAIEPNSEAEAGDGEQEGKSSIMLWVLQLLTLDSHGTWRQPSDVQLRGRRDTRGSGRLPVPGGGGRPGRQHSGQHCKFHS